MFLQDLGYKGEIGYQTFLYSTEPEIRSLLMFVVEKLPRERSEKLDQPSGREAPLCSSQSPPDGSDRALLTRPAGKLVVLQRAVAAALRAQLAEPWCPSSLRLPLQQEAQVSSRSRISEKLLSRTEQRFWALPS